MSVKSDEVADDILRAFGLEGLRVVSLSVNLAAGEPVTVQVELYPDRDAVLDALTALKRYRLTEVVQP